MELVKDFNLDDDFDLIIKNGDFKVDYSDQDHIMVILKSYIGSFKEYPLLGVGIDQYMASPFSSETIYTYIKQQLESDGYDITKIKRLEDYNFEITGGRIK